MATKTLQTRIINKNDSLQAWNTSTLPLKTGEVVFAYVETTEKAIDHNGNVVTRTVPTYLAKVGNGDKTFKELPWLHAPASDVHAWAKKASLAYEDLPESLRTAITELQTAVGEGGSVADAIDAKIATLDMPESKDTDTVNGGVVISAIKEEDGKVTVTRRALTAADIPALEIAKINGLSDAIADAKKAGTDAATAVKTLEEGTVANHTTRIATLEAIDFATKADAQGYANAKDGAIAAAKKAGDDAQDAIDAYIESNDAALDVVRTNAQKGVDDAATAQTKANEVETALANFETEAGKTYETKTDAGNKLAEAKAYTDTLANNAVKANTDAIAKLNGTGDGSVTKKVNDAIDTFATNLSENGKVDTFAELVNYVAEHGTQVTGMLDDISENASAIEALQNVGSEKNTIVTVKVNGTALTPDANRAVNVTVPTGALASKDKVAESDLATDLATKINAKAAQSDLNTAVGRIDGHDTAIEALEKDTHTHGNKALLDTYTQTEANLADAVAKKHAHDNKTVLDGITAAKVTAWDKVSEKVDQTAYNTKIGTIEGNINSHAEALTELDGRIDTIETTYVKVDSNNNLVCGADTIIIDCGTSTTVL